MIYRREIDGLRALAVIPVILFHAGFHAFQGGYVGVDVFFVISGYLITSIILAEREAGTFSLLRFYERRARRILPALFLVMLVCVPLAGYLMLPDDLENFGQSVIATTFFSNNLLLWVTSGYWGLANEFKPLLHTWSLGVEEQYYLVFPLLILATWRIGVKGRWLLFLSLAVISIAAAQILAVRAPAASFYLLPTRFWELLIGALLAMSLARRPELEQRSTTLAELAGVAGLALILGAVVLFDAKTLHPGFYTLVPTCGTAMIIAASTGQTRVGRLLGSKVLVGVGLVSYSAYLWHQPVFAFLRLASLEPPGTAVLLLGALGSFALAALSWRYVELPFRRGTTVVRGRFVVAAMSVGLLLASTGVVIYLNSGFVHLWSELNTDIRSAGRRLNTEYNERPFKYLDAEFVADDRRKVLILGNSFARDFINAGVENHYFSHSQLSYGNHIAKCMAGPESIEPRLRARIARADYLIFGSPSLDLACWTRDLAIYRQLGARKIIVIGTKNFGWNLNAVMRLDPAIRYAYRARVLQDIWDTNERIAATIPADYYVNLLGMIADPDRRVPVFTADRKIISQDREHFTKEGARYIGRILFEHPLLRDLR